MRGVNNKSDEILSAKTCSSRRPRAAAPHTAARFLPRHLAVVAPHVVEPPVPQAGDSAALRVSSRLARDDCEQLRRKD